MGDATLKPSSGDDLVLSNDDGSAKIEVNEGGDVEITPSTSLKVTLGSDSGDDFNVDSGKFVVEGDTGNVGIGTTPTEILDVQTSSGRFKVKPSGASSVELESSNTVTLSSLANHVKLDGSVNVIFEIAGNEKMRIDSSGNATLNTGNLVIGTAGKGIDFHPQGGSNVNLLDDYEEGTWTPILDSTNGGSRTGGTTTGRYTKIGRKVTAHFNIEAITVSGMSGRWKIRGLPFNTQSGFAFTTTNIMNYNVTFDSARTQAFFTSGSNDYILGLESRSNNSWVDWVPNNTSNMYFRGQITYDEA